VTRFSDPLADSAWSRPATVAGFVGSPPNETLLRFAAGELRARTATAVDLGCGAGRNAVPLAAQGWTVVGLDLSLPMVEAAARRAREGAAAGRLHIALAPMDALPLRGGCADLIVAHGIWNLARSGAEFRRAVTEAVRIAKPQAALFVFTFSRHTLPASAEPVSGETFVFTQFSGEPQCFLTEAQLTAELEAIGFVADSAVPLRELNRPGPNALAARGGPVIYEGAFRLRRR
jgi:SAM-dependent methyltransferase